MFEKVNPAHPDKVADRIAGAIVDYAYSQDENPKVAVEVLIGHGKCLIIAETSVHIPLDFIQVTVKRITGKRDVEIDYREVPQDPILASNQDGKIRCGDNGIFKGVLVLPEERWLTEIAKRIYGLCLSDGKYLISNQHVTVCQSHLNGEYFFGAPAGDEKVEVFVKKLLPSTSTVVVNPLGDWRGGIDVDSGATNRKLGSDMGRAATGGGLHGKDCSKADVTLNIIAHLLAQATQQDVLLSCSIGDEMVTYKDQKWNYGFLVEIAKSYIKSRGGFERFAEWGLIF